MKMEWSSEKVLQLLDLYRKYPLLWDPNHQDYKDRIKRKAAYVKMGRDMELSSDEIESKINRLRSQYNRELVKIIESKRSGEEVYSPKWFAFELMGQFMCGSVPRKTYEVSKDTEISKSGSHCNDDRTITNSVEIVGKSKRFKKRRKRSLHEGRKCNHIPKVYKNCSHDETTELIKALRVVNEDVQQTRDEFTLFGEYVACQIRKLSNPRLQALAKHKISTVLFEIEVKSIDEQVGTGVQTE